MMFLASKTRSLLRDSIGGAPSLWILFLLMLGTSLLSITGGASEVYKAGTILPALKHIFFLVLSFVACWITSQVPTRFYWFRGLVLYILFGWILGILLLVNPIVINGAARWTSLGFFSVQPSEYFKLFLVLGGAFVGSFPSDSPVWRNRFFIAYWVLSLFGIVYYAKENASTGILLIVFLIIYSLVIKTPRKIFLWACSFMIVGVASVYLLLMVTPDETLRSIPGLKRAPVWKARIEKMSFADEPDSIKFDLRIDEDRQKNLGQVALARGGIGGVGLGQSKTRDFLPMAYADYALAIIVEELGLLAYLWTVGLYVAWFVLAGRIGQREKNRHRKLLALGIGILIPLQALINISVVSGMFVTGQTLPLISWGGTSLVITGCAMGILINVSRTQKLAMRQEEEALDIESEDSEG